MGQSLEPHMEGQLGGIGAGLFSDMHTITYSIGDLDLLIMPAGKVYGYYQCFP